LAGPAAVVNQDEASDSSGPEDPEDSVPLRQKDEFCCECCSQSKCVKTCRCKKSGKHCVNCKAKGCTNRKSDGKSEQLEYKDDESFLRVQLAKQMSRVDQLEGMITKLEGTIKQQAGLIFDLGKRLEQVSNPDIKQSTNPSNYEEQIRKLSHDLISRLEAVENRHARAMRDHQACALSHTGDLQRLSRTFDSRLQAIEDRQAQGPRNDPPRDSDGPVRKKIRNEKSSHVQESQKVREHKGGDLKDSQQEDDPACMEVEDLGQNKRADGSGGRVGQEGGVAVQKNEREVKRSGDKQGKEAKDKE
jgi:hypothetical protein